MPELPGRPSRTLGCVPAFYTSDEGGVYLELVGNDGPACSPCWRREFFHLSFFDFYGLSLSQFTLSFLLLHSLSSSDVHEHLIIGHISNKNSFENWVLTKYTAPLLPEPERDKVRKNWMEDAERMGGP